MTTWNWHGARWWKFDFHSHTPVSDDYGKGAHQSQLKQRSPREWLLDYMTAGIDCVAVTDHNHGVWIDALKSELEQLGKEKPEGYRELVLFPGVEISVYGGIHLLAIFDPVACTGDIDSLLGAVSYTGTKGSSDGVTTKSLLEVVDAISTLGGLAIPAHVDEPKGLFVSVEAGGETLRDILQHSGIYAIEQIDRGYTKPGLYHEVKPGWTEVIGSDTHHPKDMGSAKFPGCRYTWVKMGTPSLEGLRLALLDGDPLSILRSDEVRQDPNLCAAEVIESFEIEKAVYMGRSSPFIVGMNPWLNAIIGGRGTGKSTVVEFMRKCLRRDHELSDEMRGDLEKYSKIHQQRGDGGLLLNIKVDNNKPEEITRLRLIYRKDTARFRIQWSVDSTLEAIEQGTVDPDGTETWSPTEGDIPQRFPVRIYSQKQIYQLANSPLALLRVIDDSPDIGRSDWSERWNRETGKYLALRAKAREIESGLSEEGRLRGELDDIKRKLSVFEKEGHAAILKEFQIRKRQQRAIEDWENSWADVSERLRELATGIVPDPLQADGFDLSSTADSELFRLIEQSRNGLAQIQTVVEAAAEKFDQSKVEWQSKRDSSIWKKAVTKAFEEYEELHRKLEEQNVDDASAYGSFVQKRQQIEQQLRNLEERKKEVSRLREEARNVLSDIQVLRRELTESRIVFLDQVLKDNKHVRMEIRPYAYREDVENRFRELTGWSAYEKDLGNPEKHTGLLGSILSNASTPQAIEQSMEDFRSRLKEIGMDPEHAQVADRRFARAVAALNPEVFDRLDFWFPEDSLHVKYSRDGKEFRPIAEGSPGQKTAALLAFILSYGTEPLILDQPEDDLDNHLIYDLIVRQLREAKRLRQIIVVTHNANIVVNGDAELVTALDPGKGETQIECRGSLQEHSVRESVCQIMEGGSEAFKKRYRRIIEERSHV